MGHRPAEGLQRRHGPGQAAGERREAGGWRMRGGRPPGGVTVREVGHVLDVNGARLTIGVDCDAVTLTGAGITLDAAARDLFARYYFDAEAEAEKWQQEHEAGHV